MASGGKLFLILLAAFAALSLAHLAHAQDNAWNDTGIVKDFFSSGANVPDHRRWYFMAMAAVSICLFSNILLFVFARVMHLPKWEMFAKAEFFQVTVSALLVAGFVGLADEGFNYIMAVVLPQGSTSLCMGAQQDVYSNFEFGPIGLVQCKLQEKITYLDKLYAQIYATNRAVEAKTTECYEVLNVQVYCGDWVAYYHDTMEKAHTLAHQVRPMSINLVGQYMFLDYIAKNAFAVLLPLGIVLRIIPLFRGIGGLLMAMGIGFYFIFPLAYLMLDPTTVRADPTLSGGGNAKACFKGFSGMAGTLTDVPRLLLGGGQAPDMNMLGQEMARLRVEIIFYPLAALAATLLFIQASAPFFGGDSGEIVHFVAKVI